LQEEIGKGLDASNSTAEGLASLGFLADCSQQQHGLAFADVRVSGKVEWVEFFLVNNRLAVQQQSEGPARCTTVRQIAKKIRMSQLPGPKDYLNDRNSRPAQSSQRPEIKF
jgi:hypothetical protein